MSLLAPKFDWTQARAFLAAAELGSLSAAARSLGASQPTLSRQVAAFADDLGVTLFERVGRNLVLTETGAEIAEHLKAMTEMEERVALSASGRSQSVEGLIRITASEIYAAFLLPPVLARLRREAPRLTMEIVATNAVTDLRRREADIARRLRAVSGCINTINVDMIFNQPRQTAASLRRDLDILVDDLEVGEEREVEALTRGRQLG